MFLPKLNFNMVTLEMYVVENSSELVDKVNFVCYLLVFVGVHKIKVYTVSMPTPPILIKLWFLCKDF